MFPFFVKLLNMKCLQLVHALTVISLVGFHKLLFLPPVVPVMFMWVRFHLLVALFLTAGSSVVCFFFQSNTF